VRVARLISVGGGPEHFAEEISVAAAVELLGTNSSSALEAAKRGYLVVARRDASGHIASFDTASVRKLMADYVFNRQIALQFNVSPHTIYARMQAKGFKPAVAPHHTIEGLWRRTDVEQLGDTLTLL
jgi:imidazoleglycerol phosphate dehydratase HisB